MHLLPIAPTQRTPGPSGLGRIGAIGLAVAGLVLVTGCKDHKPPVYKGAGKLVAKGPARNVIVAPDGGAVAWLADPALAKDKGHVAPDNLFLGTATFSAGGAPVTLGRDVPTLPGKFFFSPSGAQVGAVAGWSFEEEAGTLIVGDVATGEARRISDHVSFFAFSRDGKTLAFVAAGKLLVEPAAGGLEPRQLAEGVATFEFAPDGRSLVARQAAKNGGELFWVDLETDKAEPKSLGTGVADYRWSPDGSRIAFTARNDVHTTDLFVAEPAGEPRHVGKGVTSFAFSPDGKHLAFVGGVSPKKQFGDLFLLSAGATNPVKLGTKVTEYEFDPTSHRIAWLDEYRPQSRGGALTWAEIAPKPKPRKLGPNVPSFIWSNDGKHVAYVRRKLRPVFSVDLFLAGVGGDQKPRPVAQGVFGYSFTPDDERLFFRTKCTRHGRACDLRSVEVGNAKAPAKTIARAIHTYDPAPGDPSLLLITYARMDREALDVAVVPADGSAEPRMLDKTVQRGTRLLPGKAARVAYAVLDPARLGVYIADLRARAPAAAAAE